MGRLGLQELTACLGRQELLVLQGRQGQLEQMVRSAPSGRQELLEPTRRSRGLLGLLVPPGLPGQLVRASPTP